MSFENRKDKECFQLVFSRYCGYSVMVGLFLFAPIFPNGPYTIGSVEFL